MYAIFNLLTNIIITGTSIVGCVTIINKVGKFFKNIEENNNDGFKIAFDSLMMESIDDMNKCVDSVSTISTNINNTMFIVYDIIVGNKFIKKNKDGKLIICSKVKLYSGYKDKIDELTNKVKKYQDELKKFKDNKKNKKSSSSSSSSNSSSNSDSDSEIDNNIDDMNSSDNDEFELDETSQN